MNGDRARGNAKHTASEGSSIEYLNKAFCATVIVVVLFALTQIFVNFATNSAVLQSSWSSASLTLSPSVTTFSHNTIFMRSYLSTITYSSTGTSKGAVIYTRNGKRTVYPFLIVLSVPFVILPNVTKILRTTAIASSTSLFTFFSVQLRVSAKLIDEHSPFIEETVVPACRRAKR